MNVRLKRLDREDVYMTAQGVKVVQVYEEDLNALEAEVQRLRAALEKIAWDFSSKSNPSAQMRRVARATLEASSGKAP